MAAGNDPPGAYTGDALLAADLLRSLGWTRRDIDKVLAGPQKSSIHDIAGRKVQGTSVERAGGVALPDAPARPGSAPQAASSPPPVPPTTAVEAKGSSSKPTPEPAALPEPGTTVPAEGPPAEALSLSWTRASIVLQGKPDPYNQAAIDRLARDKRAGKASSEVGALQRGLEIGMSTALASTGYGAAVGVVFEALTWFLNQVIPLSSGGWEKLTPLQRLRANLYELLHNHSTEERRNSTIWKSQQLDFAADGARGDPDNWLGGYKESPPPTDPAYRPYVRNLLIRHAYAAEFFRVTRTEDEACLPAILINLLRKNRLWPPPLPPIPIRHDTYYSQFPQASQWRFYYYDLGMLDQAILKDEWSKLNADYLLDATTFRRLILPVKMAPELVTLARENGSIPQPTSPASPLYTNFGS